MSKTYAFSYPGTKADFLEQLKRYPGNDCTYYYFDNYIVRSVDGNFSFGIGRGGHSSGYWYTPELTEKDGVLFFRGEIRYISFGSSSVEDKKELPEKIAFYVLFVLALPILLPIMLWLLIRKCFKKAPDSKEPTQEEHLYDLMTGHLHCTAAE